MSQIANSDLVTQASDFLLNQKEDERTHDEQQLDKLREMQLNEQKQEQPITNDLDNDLQKSKKQQKKKNKNKNKNKKDQEEETENGGLDRAGTNKGLPKKQFQEASLELTQSSLGQRQGRETLQEESGEAKAGRDFTPLKEKLTQSFFEDQDSSEDEGLPDYKIGGYHPIHVGEILLDRYVIIQKLGWGHFSTVWLTKDLLYNNYVTIFQIYVSFRLR